MKKYVIAALLVVATLLFAGAVQATVSIGSPTIGSDTTERNTNASTTFSVSDNTLNSTTTATVNFVIASGTNVVTFDTAGLPTNTTVSSDGKTATITNWDGTAKSLPIKGTIPTTLDAVDSTLNGVTVNVGTISNNRDSTTAAINMRAANHLVLDKIRITVNDVTKSVSDGSEVRKIKVGDDIAIEITVRNNFGGSSSDGTNIDIRNIKVRAKTTNSDLDINEDDTIDVDADDEDVVEFSDLLVEDDTSDGTYNLDITIDGKDTNGARHGAEARIELRVERESHEIDVRSMSLSKTTIACDSPTTDLSVRLANIGKHDEDAVAVSVVNSALGISSRLDKIEIDEDESLSRNFNLAPKTTTPGTYTIDVISYFAGSVESHREQITLTVAACPTTTTTTTTTGTTGTGTTTGSTTGTTGTGSTTAVVVTPPSNVPSTSTSTGSTGATASVPKAKVSSTSSTKTDYSMPLLIGGIVIVVALLIVLVVLLVRPRAV
jgi:hypothetical protein